MKSKLLGSPFEINNLKTAVSLEDMHLQMKNGNNNPGFPFICG